VGFDASQIYDPKGHPGSYGFFSMRERLNYLGGGLEVKSRPGQGSQIVLTVPQGTSGHKEKT
jgi:signal transduction histidine kinase